MIRSFRHRGLRRLYERGVSRDIRADHVSRVRRILLHLETAHQLRDLDAPEYGLHPLKGDRRGTWAVKVSGNWQVTFKFENGEFFDVHYEDCH